MSRAPGLSACEQWFVHRGVPHFIVQYDAGEDILTRSIPVLVVLYLLRFPYRFSTEDPLWLNLVRIGVVLGVLLATWLLTNLFRHQRPFSWPRKIGPWELAVFVIAPVIPWLVEGDWGQAVFDVLLALVLLGIVYLGTSYAVVPLARWAIRQSIGLFDTLGTVLTRALPLLLLTVTFLFLSTEVWQVMGDLDGMTYWITLGLFFFLGLAFMVSRIPGDVSATGSAGSWPEVVALVEGTPAATFELPDEGDPPVEPLSRREYLNAALVGLFARGVQVAAVALVVGGFLILFGSLTISEATTASWVTETPNVLLTWTLGTRQMVLTEELLRVAGFLSTFTALSFTVYLVTDPTYREAFRADVALDLRQAMAVRTAYRWSLRQH